MAEPMRDRLAHAYNAFRSRDPTSSNRPPADSGYGSPTRPDRLRLRTTSERSVVAAIYNRIAIDVASGSIHHVRVDENGRYLEEMDSGLNYCLTQEANIDQTHRELIQDIVMSMFDEGVVAVVPVETDLSPNDTGGYDIRSLRTGKITEWFPRHVRVRLYNDQTGKHEELYLAKKNVAIIANPLFAVMNEPNSTLKRLIRKLAILDAIDEQSGQGKLDLIIQLPYVIKTDAMQERADTRRKDIEMQLSGSKYGIAYTDGTERITQLNRPAENNLMTQIQYLTSMLHSQLGITEEVFNGTADEKTMLNYQNKSVKPMLNAIVDEIKRKFLTKTARKQKQSVMYFLDVFSLVPVYELANIGDKMTRNEIMSSNEMRSVIGLKPSSDPRADELRNKNLNATNDQLPLDPYAEEQLYEDPDVAEDLEGE